MSAPEDCPFCKIVAGDEPARIVYATPETLAFFPDDPATLGHTLVVPRAHKATIWDIDFGLASALTETTLKVAAAVRDVMTPDGLNIIQSNGEAATQSVFHLHVHVLPRYADDNVGPIWPESGGLTGAAIGDARAHIAERLREEQK